MNVEMVVWAFGSTASDPTMMDSRCIRGEGLPRERPGDRDQVPLCFLYVQSLSLYKVVDRLVYLIYNFLAARVGPIPARVPP